MTPGGKKTEGTVFLSEDLTLYVSGYIGILGGIDRRRKEEKKKKKNFVGNHKDYVDYYEKSGDYLIMTEININLHSIYNI
jgi:hypothetical protein